MGVWGVKTDHPSNAECGIRNAESINSAFCTPHSALGPLTTDYGVI